MVEAKSSLKKRIFYSILVPPVAILPIGITLFFLDVDVSIIRDLWYLSIFVSCIIMTLRDKIPLSEIGLSTRRLSLSLFLASMWELTTFFFLGVIPFYALTGRLPILVPFEEAMIISLFHFMLVGIAEETWMRGLLLSRLKEWKPKGSAPVIWSSIIFVLLHVPTTLPNMIQNISLTPLILLNWSTLFVWSIGLAIIALKTKNLMGPIVIHGLDDFITKVIYSLQM